MRTVVFAMLGAVACSGNKSATDSASADTGSTTEIGVFDSGSPSEPDLDTGDTATEPAQPGEPATFVCPLEQDEVSPPPILGEDGCEEQPIASPPTVAFASVNSSEFLYKAATDPKGLIVIFHGGGGSKEIATTRVELVRFFNDAIAAGYSVAALDSAAHLDPPEDGKFQWDEASTSCNPDVVNTVAMIKRLKDPADLAAASDDTPVFALGISNGGSMVSRSAQHIDFSAVAVYISNATEFHPADAHIPPITIIAAENDDIVGTDGPCLLWEIIEAEGVQASFDVNFAQPLSPGLFTRIPGIDCALSKEIYSSFEDNGVIDDTGTITIDPKDTADWLPFVPAAAVGDALDIRDLVLEHYADHSFPSEFNAQTLGFFETHARSNPTAAMNSCP